MSKLIEWGRKKQKETLADPDELARLRKAAVEFAKRGNNSVYETSKSWTNALYVAERGKVFLVCAFENDGVLDGIIISELSPVVHHVDAITQVTIVDHEQINMTRDELGNWTVGIFDNTTEEPRGDGINRFLALQLTNLLTSETDNLH